MPGTFYPRCAPLGLVLATTLLACSSIPPLPTPAPQPAVRDTVVPSPTPQPAIATAQLQSGTRRYEVSWTTINQDLDRSVRDSSDTNARVDMALMPGTGGRLGVTAVITWAGPDSLKPDTLRASIDPTGEQYRQENAPAGCPRQRIRDFPPLLLRLLLMRVVTQPPAVDSVAYRSCSGGVVRASEGTLAWDGEARRPASALQLKARVTADSSRALPMYVTGSTNGNARQDIEGADVKGLEGEFVTELVARGPNVIQRVRQQVRFRGRVIP